MGNAFIFQSYYSLFEKFRLAFERNQKCKGDFMKNKKNKLFMSLGVLLICFLISSSLNSISVASFVNENRNLNQINTFDKFDWFWILTEVVSTESPDNSDYPSLAVDSSGNLHVAWQDASDYASADTDIDIFYKKWNASTKSWTITEVVSTESTANSYYPSLAVDSSGNVHVAWQDATNYDSAGNDWDIFYKSWNASTHSWTTTEVVSTESTQNSINYPSLAVDSSGNVHIIWDDWTVLPGADSFPDVFYKHRNASTHTWTTTEVVSTQSQGDSIQPSLAIDSNGNIHAVWIGDDSFGGHGGDWDIFYKRWNATTQSWEATEVVSTESADHSYNPSLAVDSSGNAHLTWHDSIVYGGSGNVVLYKRWDVITHSWSSLEVVSTESTGYSEQPSLVIDSSANVHIAWSDDTNYTNVGTDWDIFYKQWEVSTSTWTTTEVISTESTGDSTYPSLAIDSDGFAYTVWSDNTNFTNSGTDRDIFYKVKLSPPIAPELSFIIPNPSENSNIYLDWNDVFGADYYHVYRSSSYIWSVEGLNPIITVSSSEYLDTVPSEGFYYYAVVTGNLAGNSSHSNCQYVEVKFSVLEAPELSFILPNPIDTDSVSLMWDNVEGAVEYFAYRSESYIWSVEGLTPVATVVSANSFIDTLPSEGFYFYVIVANDGVRNSSHSNCEYIQYKLPTLQEFTIVSSLIFGTFVVLFVVMRTRKKKP